tara:strand:- start:1867 stop:2589 length:723 start_codon:yes stop_codon:yes gene_type:complete
MKLENKMTFLEHAEQLRWGLIRVFIIIFFLMFISFIYSDIIQSLILRPIQSFGLENFKLQDIKITSPFMVKIVISLFSSLILGFPYFVFEIYRFIYPAISKISKIYLFFTFILSITFFVIGCIFGYLYLFPASISFFVNLTDQNVAFNPERLNFIFYSFWLIIVCGLIYQLPIVSLILTKLRIINYEFLRQMRAIALVVFLVFGAIISPPDPLSQLLIAFPLYILYELSILISYIFRAKS